MSGDVANDRLTKEVEELRQQLIEKEVELRRLRRQPPNLIGCVDEATLDWKVCTAEFGSELVLSPEVRVGRLPFRLACTTSAKPTTTGESKYATPCHSSKRYLLCTSE